MICSFAYLFSKNLPIFYQSWPIAIHFPWEVAASMVNMISVHSAWTAIQLCSLHALCKLHAPLLSSSRVCVYALEYYIHVHCHMHIYVVCKCAICLELIPTHNSIAILDVTLFYVTFPITRLVTRAIFPWGAGIPANLTLVVVVVWYVGTLNGQQKFRFGIKTDLLQMYPCTLARWWQQMNIFYFQPYLPGEDFSNLTSIFFRWVGSTTN